MKDKYRMFERVNGFRNLLAALPAAFFFSLAMAEDITISQEDIAAGKFPTSTTLTIDSGDNVTLLRGTDYVINIESSTQRWQFLNSGIFNIEAGAYFKVSNANNALSSGMSCNAAGNLNISGEAVFLRYSTSNTASGLWLIYDSYGSGAPGTVTVEDGGILRAYYTNVQGSTNETGTCRIMVGWNSNSQTSSKLVLKAGSTVCAQGIELYKGATLRVEKEVSMYENLTQTSTTYIILGSGSTSTLEFGDGAVYKQSLLVKNNSNTSIVLDGQKSDILTLGTIYSYDSSTSNKATLNFVNFENNYILLNENCGFTISGDDGSAIELAAFNDNWKTMEAIFTAYEDESMTEGFSGGWYFEEAYGDDGELLGVYLNNSNFPIPEPADFAFIFGVLALIGVLAKRRLG